MNLKTTLTAATIVAMTAIAPAMAVTIGNGTVTTADIFVPTISLATAPATYSVNMGMTLNTIGTAGFAGTTGRTGTENGTLMFSSTIGTTITESVGSFFVFSDPTQTYTFSVDSVRTENYNSSPASTAIALYLLGTTASPGFEATATSLTLNFNSTGGSPYAVSQSLAIPPSGTGVPEPASLAVLGTGLAGLGFIARRRRR